MDALDRAIVDRLQDGLPLEERPFRTVAAELGTEEGTLIERVERMLGDGTLSRFGPMYDAARLGGAFSLCAMEVPPERFDEVAERVNARPEVAHNYQRDHALNMWFVLATEDPGSIPRVIAEIEAATGLTVLDLPKEEEYFVGLRLDA